MYNTICIVGLGTLGGFLTYHLFTSETSKELILFDYDTVELENIKNSIYTRKDIGKLKTLSIFKKLDEPNNVILRNEKFIEGITDLKKCDLIIDCRDFTYDRENIIDIRLYISSRTLIIDCRKNIKNEIHHEGQYLNKLSKTDVNNAALNATILISNGNIKKLIEKQMVQQIKLDYSLEETKEFILRNKNKSDLVYDPNQFEKKLINLHENYPLVKKVNKDNDITLCFGPATSPFSSKKYPLYYFRTINDLISECSSMVQSIGCNYNSYIVSVNYNNDKHYVELLPETGGA